MDLASNGRRGFLSQQAQSFELCCQVPHKGKWPGVRERALRVEPDFSTEIRPTPTEGVVFGQRCPRLRFYKCIEEGKPVQRSSL